MTERDKMMRRLAAVDFTVYETVLYLDGHPNDKRALEFLREKKREAMDMRKQYEAKYGGVTVNGAGTDGKWGWVDGPWPWQTGKEGA